MVDAYLVNFPSNKKQINFLVLVIFSGKDLFGDGSIWFFLCFWGLDLCVLGSFLVLVIVGKPNQKSQRKLSLEGVRIYLRWLFGCGFVFFLRSFWFHSEDVSLSFLELVLF